MREVTEILFWGVWATVGILLAFLLIWITDLKDQLGRQRDTLDQMYRDFDSLSLHLADMRARSTFTGPDPTPEEMEAAELGLIRLLDDLLRLEGRMGA